MLATAIVAVLLTAPAPAGPQRAVTTFPLTQVRLLDGPFADAQRRDVAYLLQLDPDRLLHTFRLNAGLPTRAKPYGGWEAPEVELRRHSLGHYLSACSLMFQATGDERLKARAVAIVQELRKVQRALPARGMHEGYLSAFPEEFLDRVGQRKNVWAPYYTLHKILAGLLDVHRATGDTTALELARAMAAWVGVRARGLSDERWQAMLATEYGGMQDSLAELYALTGGKLQLSARDEGSGGAASGVLGRRVAALPPRGARRGRAGRGADAVRRSSGRAVRDRVPAAGEAARPRAAPRRLPHPAGQRHRRGVRGALGTSRRRSGASRPMMPSVRSHPAHCGRRPHGLACGSDTHAQRAGVVAERGPHG